ncbi:MAG: hypothetical protein LUQ50_05300 [Methanospirillum sp.]|uniref:hypothetical protein n=1 Tax=Methanospirillum sp. TaxID=45200 RepID=UPI0023691490|nr:hypothetical protein [Methanospirillum sp.]MDD1728469.1 hypothetical protein [Methanospirillum sp.]
MDLAQSILKELITLQNKNEELARIITKLEKESDIIIHQFEKKIEELQKTVKHEQDDKSRAARRYEAELDELGKAKDALIQEITGVRDTFQARINQLDEKIQSLTSSLQERESAYTALVQEKDDVSSHYEQTIAALQSDLADREAAARNEQELLSSQKRALAETIRQDRDRFSFELRQKEEELHLAGKALQSMDQRLREYADRETDLEEQSRLTVDHLHHLITTERQIRSRELKERDILVSGLEEDCKVSRLAFQDIESRTRKEAEANTQEITRLQVLLSDAEFLKTRVQEENSTLTDLLAAKTSEYEKTLTDLTVTSAKEKEHLQRENRRIREDFAAAVLTHDEIIRKKDEEYSSLTRQIDEQTVFLHSVIDEKERVYQELTIATAQLEKEKVECDRITRSAETEQIKLQNALDESNQVHRVEREQLKAEVLQNQNRSAERERTLEHMISGIRSELQEVGSERDQLIAEKQSREDYYRNEITSLHQELAIMQESLKSRETDLLKDITLRESQIQDLVTNNEALRIEIDRVRQRYHKLQETIRAEKDESVHALYREITALEEKLTGRDRDISSLSKAILRLDAENTRLIQENASEKHPVAASPSQAREPEPEPAVPISVEISSDINDPLRKEVLLLTGDLEDPARATDAAVKLASMGHAIVDLLIPLLHTGSIQRRVWIAVVLYEINDNRATLPLMRLLETPKVHFRELIWEAKSQYHIRMRIGSPDESGLKTSLSGSGML